MSFTPSNTSKVKRGAQRAHYDKATVYSILDAHFMCHVAYVHNQVAITLPMAYARKGNTLYLHGATANRMLKGICNQPIVSATVTHLDGLVLARSAFHHSVNYRSAVIFGKPRAVIAPQEKTEAFEALIEQMAKGRWQEVRKPNANELKITNVVAIDITEASAKIRQGPPVDDESDYDLPLWAGTLPLKHLYETAQPDPKLAPEIETPPSVKALEADDK